MNDFTSGTLFNDLGSGTLKFDHLWVDVVVSI